MISHRAVIASIITVAASASPRQYSAPGDKALAVIPTSHIYGLITLVHLCPYLGITSTLFQSLPPFEKFLNIMETLKVNHLFLAPPLINAFLKHPAAQGRDFSYFKSCIAAAAPLDSVREDAFKALVGPNFVLGQAYGMTETSTYFFFIQEEDICLCPFNYLLTHPVRPPSAGLVTGLPVGSDPVSGSVGRLLPLAEGRVTDSKGNVLGIGQRGELRVRGPQLCSGYLDNDKATEELFDSEGYVYSGDEVEIRGDGDIFVLDRLKQMIKSKVGCPFPPALIFTQNYKWLSFPLITRNVIGLSN